MKIQWERTIYLNDLTINCYVNFSELFLTIEYMTQVLPFCFESCDVIKTNQLILKIPGINGN